jgi:tetratricopeptide (TPR) repeat protein
MPNLCLAASLRLMLVVSSSFMAISPAWGQIFSGGPSDGSRVFGYSTRGLIDLEESTNFPDSREHVPAGPATISSDMLRHPLTSRARKRLQKALHLSELGNHVAAIQELRETMVKEPSSAPYTQNFLGVELVENQQFAEARTSFEEAVRLLPHESINHSNLGFTLAVAGELKSAEQEARKAIQLDPGNSRAKYLLDLLHTRRTKKR